MAINAMIPMGVQVADPLNALAKGYELGNTIRQQPMMDKLNQQKLDAGQVTIDAAKQKMVESARDFRVKSAVMGAAELQNAPVEQWANILQDRIKGASRYGYDAEAEQEALQILQSQGPEALKPQIDGLVKFGTTTGVITAGSQASVAERYFNQMTQGMTPEEIQRAKRIELGLDPRAVASAPSIVDIGGVKYVTNPMSGSARLPVLDQGIPGGNMGGALPPPVPGGQQAGASQPAAPSGQQAGAKPPTVLDANAVATNAAIIEAEKSRAKVVGAQQGEKAVQGIMNAPTALTLMDDMDKALQAQPESALGRGVQSGLGFFGFGDEEKQAGMSVADTAGAQLMAYAEKLPGPASDADRQDFKASVGILASSVATREQKRAALAQARKSFQRLVQKYGAQGQSSSVNSPTADPLSKSYDYEYDPVTGSFK